MSGKEFHQQLSKLFNEAMSGTDALSLYAVVGITQCTLQDFQIRAFLEIQREAAAAFAAQMADGAKPGDQ